MTQRLNSVTNPEGKAADLLGAVKATLGATPNLFTAFANAPTAMEGYLSLNTALQSGALNSKFKLALTPLVMAAGETGKEILSPVATVIFSGLFSSTLLNLIVTPIVFWKFGEKAALSYLNQKEKA